MGFALPDETAPGGIPASLTPGLLDKILAALSEGMQRAGNRPLPGDLLQGVPWSRPSMVPPQGQTIGPIPAQPALQAISDAVGRIKGVAQATASSLDPATQSPYDVGLAQVLPFLTEMLAGNKQEMFGDLATGFPITEGKNQTLGIKPQYAGDVLDILGAAAPVLGAAKTMAGSMPRVGRAAEEGILRWGGDPTLMYSHGLSKGLTDPAGDPLKTLINPSLAITGASSHRNPFGSDYGILIPRAGLGEDFSRIGNRDLYIGRSDDAPGGYNPSPEEFIAQMGLVPPPKTEGSSFYNWAERNPHTGQWQMKKPEDLSLPLASNPHNAAIFSSPEFQNFKAFEERAGGASVLGADYASVSNWSDEADRLFRSWYQNKFGHSPSMSTDWLKTLREAAKDTRRTRGDDEAKSLLELFKTAPSEYGELKVGGRIPITGEHWAGAILKPDTYSRFEALLQNRGIPTVLSPSGNNRYSMIHDIASQMQQDAGPLKAARGLEPTVGGGSLSEAPTFKLEAKRAGATGSPTFDAIGKAAQNAMNQGVEVFNYGGKSYKVDPMSGDVFPHGQGTSGPLFNIADVHPTQGWMPQPGSVGTGPVNSSSLPGLQWSGSSDISHSGMAEAAHKAQQASIAGPPDGFFNYNGKDWMITHDGTLYEVGGNGMPVATLHPPTKGGGEALPKIKLGDLEAHVIGETGQSPHFYAHEQFAKHQGDLSKFPHVFTDDGDSYMLHSTGNVYALDAKGEKVKKTEGVHPDPLFNVKPGHKNYSAPTETPIPQPAPGSPAAQAKAAILANQKPIIGPEQASAQAALWDQKTQMLAASPENKAHIEEWYQQQFKSLNENWPKGPQPAKGGGEAPTLGESLAKAKAKAASSGGALTGWLDPSTLPHGVVSKDIIADAKAGHAKLMEHDKKEHFADDDSLTFKEVEGVRYHVAKNGDIFADDTKIGSIHNPKIAKAGGSPEGDYMMQDYAKGLVPLAEMHAHLAKKFAKTFHKGGMTDDEKATLEALSKLGFGDVPQ